MSRIGAVAVPMSTFYSAQELRAALRSGDVHILIAAPRILSTDIVDLLERALPDLVDEGDETIAVASAPFLRSVCFTESVPRRWASLLPLTAIADTEAGVPRTVLAEAERQVHPADIAVMVHTSGSSGPPKAVVHSHGAVMRQSSHVPAALRGMSPDHPPRVLCSMPFFWIGGVLMLTGALHAPVTLLVLPRPEAGATLELLEREGGTAVAGWPTFTQKLRAHPDFARRDLSRAPTLTAGPDDISMLDVPGETPTHRGMSETAGSFTCVETAVVAEDGSPVGPGEPGELLVRGAGVMVGYNKRERHEVFDADGWYHTGDRVFRLEDDPRLFYAGRDSELIKTAGANVSPPEVEAVIARNAAVRHCLVVGAPHPERGEEVCAVIVPAVERIDLVALAAYVRASLSVFKVPTRWIVVDESVLPMLSTGKPDRRALRAAVAEGRFE